MKKSTVRILVYLVIFLGVLNIATFSTIAYHIYSEKNAREAGETATMGNGKKYNGRAFRDRLGLEREQMTTFKEVNETFRSNARKINAKLNETRSLMLEEMKKQPSDTVLLNNFSDSIGRLHADLKKYTYKYYKGVLMLCNESQKEELDKIFEEFFVNDLHFNNKGRFENRNRFGRNKNN